MKTTMMIAAGLASLGLAGCVMDEGAVKVPAGDFVPEVQQVENAKPLAGWRPMTYQCAGGKSLNVQFSPDGDRATIEQMGEVLLMKQVVSASGARYQAASKDYAYQLDTKGKMATLYGENDRQVLSDCVIR